MTTIVLSTGGTGGHVFPANQLAYALRTKGYNVYGVTDQRGAQYLDKPAFHNVLVLNLHKGGGRIAQLKQLLSLMREAIRCFKVFRQNPPALIVAFGGHMSVPPLLAARLLGIPYILHESNAVLGRVNRWMAEKAKAVAVGFPSTAFLPLRCPLVITGNPVRDIFFSLAEESPPASDKIRLFVFGGSQGAALFSRVVPEAIALLSLDRQKQLELVMQVRLEFQDQTQEYLSKTSAILYQFAPFFPDLPQQLYQSHLVMARAGAMTVSEIAAMGRSALFVPLKIATDNHQYHNVKDIVDRQAAWMLLEEEFTPQKVSMLLEEMITEHQQNGERAKRIRHYGHAHATQALVEICEEKIKKGV